MPRWAIIVVAVIVAVVALMFGLRFALQPKESNSVDSLTRAYYDIGDPLAHPDTWRDVLARQKMLFARLEALQSGDMFLRDIRRRLEDAQRYDGVEMQDANIPQFGAITQPFLGKVDFSSWVEGMSANVAMGNPTTAPVTVSLALRSWSKEADKTKWPEVAQTKVDVAPREVVIVRIDGLPTRWGQGGDWRTYALLASIKRNGMGSGFAPLVVQNVGYWGARVSSPVVSPGKVDVEFPSVWPDAVVKNITGFVLKRAKMRLRDQLVDLQLVPGSTAKVFETDHGFLVVDSPAKFALDLPPGDDYDTVTIPEVAAKIVQPRMHATWREAGPVLILLGKNTKVRRETVTIPAPKPAADEKPAGG